MVGKRSSYVFLVTSITRMIFTFIPSIICIAKFNIYEVCAQSFDRTRNLRQNLETSIHALNDSIASCGDLTPPGTRCNGGCTVLVNDLRSTYQSCENYCHGHNRKCVGAWDADDYSCRAKNMSSCDFNFTSNLDGPPDALCKCSTDLFQKATSGTSKFFAVSSSDVPSDVPPSAPLRDVPSVVTTSSNVPTSSKVPTSPDVLSDVPSSAPNDVPSVVPSDVPSSVLSSSPSDVPSDVPSSTPSKRPERRPVEDPTCGNLTRVRLRCNGKCTVLVNDLSSTYQSCENYCQGHNRQCVGAWNTDEKSSCKVKETYGCDFKFTHTSDALCRCSTELFQNDSGSSTKRKNDSSGESSIFSKNLEFLNEDSNKIAFPPTVQPKCPEDEVSQAGYKQFPSPTGRHYDEISMIAVSKQLWHGQPVIWIANDKDENHVYASALYTGENLCSVELPYKMDNDIESMSIGPCNTDRTTSCLYVANIGNNLAQSCKGGSCNTGAALRSIFKFKEPDIHRQSGKVEASIATLPINYMDISSPSERADAESFFVDFTGDKNNGKPGDLYIVTKWNNSRPLTRLFKYPVEFHENANYGETSEVYSPQATTSSTLKKRRWTDADMSVDGSLIAVRDSKRVYFFTRSSSESVAEALKKKPCKYVHKTPRSKSYSQFEAVGFIPYQNAFAEISECKRSNYGVCDPHAYVVVYK